MCLLDLTATVIIVISYSQWTKETKKKTIKSKSQPTKRRVAQNKCREEGQNTWDYIDR